LKKLLREDVNDEKERDFLLHAKEGQVLTPKLPTDICCAVTKCDRGWFFVTQRRM